MIKYSMNNNPVIGLVLLADNMDRLMDGKPIVIKREEAKKLWGIDAEFQISYFRDEETCVQYMQENGMITDTTNINS